MIRPMTPAACFFALALAWSSASLAGSEPSEPEAPPPIDWRDFVDDKGDGDHVVGEELCAAPGATEPVPDLPVYA
jgi:hypothetical protein